MQTARGAVLACSSLSLSLSSLGCQGDVLPGSLRPPALVMNLSPEDRLAEFVGSEPHPGLAAIASEATAEFNVGVILLVASNALEPPFQCHESHNNPLLFGETFDTDVASCGPREAGPWSEGTVMLRDGKDWRLHVRGAASDGTTDAVATGFVNAQWRDVFTVVPPATDPTSPVPAFVRFQNVWDIENAPFSFLRFEIEVIRFAGSQQIPVLLYCQDYGSSPSGRQCPRDARSGAHTSLAELPLGTFPPGTRFRVSATLDAVAESGGDFGTLADPKVAEAEVSISLCSRITDGLLLGASGAAGACTPAGDVRVRSVEPVQSVFGAPLIAGKDTVIAVDVESSFADPIDAEIQVTVDTPFGPQTLSSLVTVPAGCPSSKRFYLPHPTSPVSPCDPSETTSGMLAEGLAPVTGQDYRIAAALVPPEPDEDPSNDVFPPVSHPVKTTGMRLGYAGVLCSGCSPAAVPPAQYTAAVSASNTWMTAMYPLSPDGFRGDRCLIAGVLGADCVILGDTTVQAGMLRDLDDSFRTVSRADPLVERVIALVPAGYFPYHGGSPITGGLTLPGYGDDRTSLVNAAKAAGALFPGIAVPVVPHEIAHQVLPVGWNGGFDHYGFPAAAPPEVPPIGYFVGCCEVPATAQNLMEADLRRQPPDLWIDQPTYAEILPSVLLLPDPAILLITGFETRAGEIQVRSMDELPAGRPSPTHPGDHFIDLLDDAGRVLSTTSVTAPFKGIVEGAGDYDIIEFDRQSISIKLAYPPETARIRWRIHERVLHEMDPVPQTLRTAIELLPDRAFVKNPSQRRTAVLAKVDAFGTMLEKKAFEGALQKLRSDLRPRIEEWIAEFVIDDAGQLNKAALLDLVDRVEARVEARAALQ